MHILVATDGHLDAEKAAGLITRLYKPDDPAEPDALNVGARPDGWIR